MLISLKVLERLALIKKDIQEMFIYVHEIAFYDRWSPKIIKDGGRGGRAGQFFLAQSKNLKPEGGSLN